MLKRNLVIFLAVFFCLEVSADLEKDFDHRGFYECKYDFGKDSQLVHSLCSWKFQGILCKQMSNPRQCRRWEGDVFWEDSRLSYFTSQCPDNCFDEAHTHRAELAAKSAVKKHRDAQARARKEELK